MSSLVTCLAQADTGKRLVLIGLTDEVIEHIKKTGALLEDAEHTQRDTDIAILYKPTLNELMKQIKGIIPKNAEVKIV